MTVTIYHNPRCSKSRKTLALLQENGIVPTIVEYLKETPSVDELKEILEKMGKSPRDIMRKKESKEVGLSDPSLTDEALLEGMVAHPTTIERPIVVKGNKAAMGRPPEDVLKIL